MSSHSATSLLPLMLLLAACAGDPVSGPGPADAMQVVDGGTTTEARVILESADRFDTVVVRVVDALQRPVPGAAVSWTTDDPDAAITALDETSDASGLARAEWRLSGAPGTWRAYAHAAGGLEAVFDFTITSWSVKRAVVVGSRTCVQSHDDQLWCRSSNTAPLELQLDGAKIREAQGSASVLRSDLCVLDFNGTIRCAEVADGPLVFVEVPGQVTTFVTLAMAASSETFCAIDTDGHAWCWGRNHLGDGPYHAQFREELGPVTQPDGVRFTAMAVSHENGCGIDQDGTPWCWGKSVYGVTGADGGPDVQVPREITVPVPLVSITTPAHGGSMCGLTADRRAICWGNGLGFGSHSLHATPLFLPGANDAVTLAPMPDGYVALRVKGELMGWGVFYFGHSDGPGSAGPLPAASAVRVRAISRGLGLEGRTCIDDAAGKGTVCAATRDIGSTTFASPVLWIGLVPP